MKVKVIYDFSVEEIEDFSKDRVIIEMNFGEFKRLQDFLDDVWIEKLGTPIGKEAKKWETKLRNYETESKF